jgi:hypothetical protein
MTIAVKRVVSGIHACSMLIYIVHFVQAIIAVVILLIQPQMALAGPSLFLTQVRVVGMPIIFILWRVQ